MLQKTRNRHESKENKANRSLEESVSSEGADDLCLFSSLGSVGQGNGSGTRRQQYFTGERETGKASGGFLSTGVVDWNLEELGFSPIHLINSTTV